VIIVGETPVADPAWRERRRVLEETGELEVIHWFGEAAKAGAPMKEVVKVRVDYGLGRITREEAVRRLRELARNGRKGM